MEKSDALWELGIFFQFVKEKLKIFSKDKCEKSVEE